MASNDTTFISQVTVITSAWLQNINDWLFKRYNPTYATSTGVANTYILTLPAISLLNSYQAGQEWVFKAHQTNTGAATFNVFGSASLGALAIQVNQLALTGGEIQTGDIVKLTYDGTLFQMNITRQVDGNPPIWAGTAGGTANDLTISPAQAVPAYKAGQTFRFIVGGSTNTGATTLAVSGLAAKALVGPGNAALGIGELTAGALLQAVYSGTYFEITGLRASTAGRIWEFGGSSTPARTLLCDGSEVSRATYSKLFTAISTTWGAGDGSTTFNVPNLLGRVRIGAGAAGSASDSGTTTEVDTTGDTLQVPANDAKWITGMNVVFTLTSGTITGLTTGTYYVVRFDAAHIRLATTRANAQNNVYIDLTAKSSPIWTITKNLTARTLGQVGGEEVHAINSDEALAHTHLSVASGASVLGTHAAGNDVAAGTNGSFAGTTTGSFGGNQAMNIMPPFAATLIVIDY